jgi:D-sedoheptulose 7-phosphate isomerase
METHDKARRILNELTGRLPELAPCAGQIWGAYELLRATFAGGGKLLLCGNGGSAADAEHWAGELLKGFCSKRPLPPDALPGLDPAIAGRLQGALPAIPLTGFLSLSSAFANDVDAELTFAQLVWALGRPGDTLVCISTSGQARNVLAAAQTARARGLRTLALTARDGGALAPQCDQAIQAPADQTHRAQEYHLPIYHALCLMLEGEMFSD